MKQTLIDKAHLFAESSTINEDRPQSVYWDITYRCNLMCKHCLNNAGDPSQVNYQDELSHKEIISVANDIASLKPGSICICQRKHQISPADS